MRKEIVKTYGLTKEFKFLRPDKKNVIAVNHVDMTVKEGDIYALIGKNGAGKSTLLKMLAGLYIPTAGQYELFNNENQSLNIQRVGVLIEEPGIYGALTPRDHLELLAIFHGIHDECFVDKLLEEYGLSDYQDKQVQDLSTGMKQRLAIAMSLTSDPDLLILDEPTNGLDPQAIKDFRDMILYLQAKGKTIIISSHILGEVGKIATRYGIIRDGQLVQEISKQEIQELSEDFYFIEVDNIEKAVVVLEHNFDNKFQVSEAGIELYDYDNSSQIIRELVKHDIEILASGVHRIDAERYLLAVMEGKPYEK